MRLTTGWFLLVGGFVGTVRCAVAKKFYESDFANLDGVIADEQGRTEVSVTPVARWLIVAGCLLLTALGVILIQHAHNWNPFIAA
jgi:phosphotransferase system  glucose/maltose/N-acetylglucosamine-specific IIC component